MPRSPLALYPETGGPNDLPIVRVAVDDEDDDEHKKLAQKPRLVIVGGGWGVSVYLRHGILAHSSSFRLWAYSKRYLLAITMSQARTHISSPHLPTLNPYKLSPRKHLLPSPRCYHVSPPFVAVYFP